MSAIPGSSGTTMAKRWRVRVELPSGLFQSCEFIYPSPIDDRGVRTTPAVVEWVAETQGTIHEVYSVR